MSIELLGIATARPAGTMTQEQALELHVSRSGLSSRRSTALRRLFARSTVLERASVLIETDGDESALEGLRRYYPAASQGQARGPSVAQRMQRYEQEVLPLAARAATLSIEAAQVDRDEIAQLVTVSCTGFAAPGLDIRLVRELDLAPTVGRSAIGFMGCQGALNGLRVAAALADAAPGSSVLLCAVELCTLHFHYDGSEGQVVANTLFADGAAATIVRRRDDGAAPPARWRLRASGSSILPDSTAEMSWRIGDHGFEMTLASRVPLVIGTHLRAWLCAWLAQHGTTPEAVRSWAIHPGGPRVIDAVEQALDLPRAATETSRQILAEHGNMSSPTVLFILERLAAKDAHGPCVVLAFGPGLVVEAALLD